MSGQRFILLEKAVAFVKKNLLFQSAARLIFFTLLAKMIVFGREVIIGKEIGVNSNLDAFIIAFLIVQFISDSFFEALGFAAIPELVSIKNDKLKLNKVYHNLLTYSIAAGTFLIVIAIITFPIYINKLTYSFSSNSRELTFSLVLLLIPYYIINIINVIGVAFLNAMEDFLPGVFYPCIPAIFSVLLIFFPIFPNQPIKNIAFGASIGAIVFSIFLTYYLKFKKGINFGFARHCSDHFKIILQQWLPIIASSLITTFSFIINQSVASKFEEGSIASINYALKLNSVINIVFVSSLSTLLLPKFSNLIINNNWSFIKRNISKILATIFISALLLSLFIVLISNPMIKLLFERGKFTANNTNQIATLFSFYTLSFSVYLTGIIALRVISAMKLNKVIFFFSISNLIFTFFCIRWGASVWGLKGIPISAGIVYFLNASIIIIFLYYKLNKMVKFNTTSLSLFTK